VLGRGDRPLPFVSATDVAHVVCRAALDPGLRGQVLEVAGAGLTMTELAHALQASHGWTGAIRHVPRPALRVVALLARPVAPAVARAAAAAVVMDTDPGAPPAVRPELLGRPPLGVADVLLAGPRPAPGPAGAS
jgi:uncharacterized protein YbjT (DUF2867 family)